MLTNKTRNKAYQQSIAYMNAAQPVAAGQTITGRWSNTAAKVEPLMIIYPGGMKDTPENKEYFWEFKGNFLFYHQVMNDSYPPHNGRKYRYIKRESLERIYKDLRYTKAYKPSVYPKDMDEALQKLPLLLSLGNNRFRIK